MTEQRGRRRRETADEVSVRRPVGTILSVRVPRELLFAVDELAQSRGVSVSEVVREAIQLYFRVPQVTISMPIHGTSAGILRLAGPNIEFVGVAQRTQTFEHQYEVVSR